MLIISTACKQVLTRSVHRSLDRILSLHSTGGRSRAANCKWHTHSNGYSQCYWLKLINSTLNQSNKWNDAWKHTQIQCEFSMPIYQHANLNHTAHFCRSAWQSKTQRHYIEHHVLMHTSNSKPFKFAEARLRQRRLTHNPTNQCFQSPAAAAENRPIMQPCAAPGCTPHMPESRSQA